MKLSKNATSSLIPIRGTTYQSILKQINKHQKYNEIIKIGGLISMLLICILVYLYYINISSTLGYYLRQEERILANKQFEYNTIVLQKLQGEQLRRQQLINTTKPIDITQGSNNVIRLITTQESTGSGESVSTGQNP